MVNDLPTIVPQGSENTRNWFSGASWELSQIAQMAGCWVSIAGNYYCMTKPPQHIATYNNHHLFVHDSAVGTGLTWAVLQISPGVTHELVIFSWVDCSRMI